MARDLLSRPAPPPDHRIHYAPGEFQFGDLRLPPDRLAPVVVVLHGGWWQSGYSLDYAGHFCAALKSEGIATWSLEYRRIGNPGGGWPGTFADVALGYDFLATLAETFPLDLHRVLALGHSAGGHLAFWLAGRPHLPGRGPLQRPPAMLPMRAVVALAGAVDLRLLLDLAGRFTFAPARRNVLQFMGATPAEAPDRYAAANPGDLLPLNLPQVLIQGTYDDQIPPQLPVRWAERGRNIGETVFLETIAGASHMDLVDPESHGWPRIRDIVKKLL